MRRLLAIASGAGLLGLAVAGAGVWLYARHALAPVDPSHAGSPQLFEVERGASLASVARGLEAAGLVRDARAMTLLARYLGVAGRLHVGEYEISPGDSTRETLDRLVRGEVKTWELVVPEGIRASEIAHRIEEAGLGSAEAFFGAATDPALAASLGIQADTLEGYLYPETYHLPRRLPPEEIARVLVREFESAWQRVEPLARDHELSRHEIVTLASIVEKETAAPEERPLIAAVFLNRLARGMRLETDPTVIYGIPDFDGNLQRRHLEDAGNPYNTYRHRGLPPGPIASPGEDALRAVLEPADSDYLYFVSRNDGTHQFSASYREHVNAVNRYQKRRRTR